jgi:lipid-A-disaccharide synthase
MKYFLISGEPSGDMHAAELMCGIKTYDPEAEFQFFGGDLMLAQGGTLLKHYREMAFMGILPVILNIKKIRRNFNDCEKAILNFKPHLVVLIDYPGFNLRIARFSKLHNFKTAYYISPKIWAWKTKRVFEVKRWVDQMYTIFPFETAFYKKYDYEVNYVGNPVFDLIQFELEKPVNFELFCKTNHLSAKPIIALLAGSRTEEIKGLLPIMEQLADFFPDFQLVVAGAPNQSNTFYRSIMKKGISVVFNQTYQLLRVSSAAVVTSGTATLETALLNTPQVVVYKMGMGWLLERLKKYILKTKFFSLVNLIADKQVVTELFQSEVTVQNIQHELDKILNNNIHRSSILKGYDEIAGKLGSKGAAGKAAAAIVKSLKATEHV